MNTPETNLTPTRPNRIIDLTGQVFERLTVTGLGDRTASGKIRWWCMCICGKEKLAHADHLKSGSTRSCGCLNLEVLLKMSVKHGNTRNKQNTPEYTAWCGMFKRCNNDPKSKSWPYYTGRGITVCQRWKDSFQNFLDDMGLKPSPLHSIDRINNDGNYEPLNCKWSTKKEQSLNRRPRSVCWHGHPLTEDNTSGPRRRCRTCAALRGEEYKVRRKDMDRQKRQNSIKGGL